MADQDPSERFDYLFEPLDGETTTAYRALATSLGFEGQMKWADRDGLTGKPRPRR